MQAILYIPRNFK